MPPLLVVVVVPDEADDVASLVVEEVVVGGVPVRASFMALMSGYTSGPQCWALKSSRSKFQTIQPAKPSVIIQSICHTSMQ